MKALVLGLVGAVALASSGAVGAQTVVYDADPQVGFVYGNGNDYLPANAAVLNSGVRSIGEISGRAHVPTQPASSTGSTGIYTFSLGQNVSFDFSFSSGSISNASVTITNVADGADASFAAALLGTIQSNGALQGSQQLGFGFLNGGILASQDINFDNMVNSTYRIDLSGGGLTNTFFAQIGTGAVAAVPEPATWAMMLIGFGAIGVSLRRRRRANGLLQAA